MKKSPPTTIDTTIPAISMLVNSVLRDMLSMAGAAELVKMT
jgi:hypothetical protein